MTPAYRYRATALRILDADTMVLDVDLGFRTHAHVLVRLRGIDAPELHTPEGKAAKAAVEAWLVGQPLLLESYKDQQSFARCVRCVSARRVARRSPAGSGAREGGRRCLTPSIASLSPTA